MKFDNSPIKAVVVPSINRLMIFLIKLISIEANGPKAKPPIKLAASEKSSL